MRKFALVIFYLSSFVLLSGVVMFIGSVIFLAIKSSITEHSFWPDFEGFVCN